MVDNYSNRTLLTKEGYQRLSEKIDEIQKKVQQKRDDMSRTADNGDLSENAGFMAAKESYKTHLNNLNDLQDVLREDRVESSEEIDDDRVSFGTTVTLKEVNQNKEYTYRLVGKHEARLEHGEISIQSPVAQGLLDHEPGEVVEVETPRGMSIYKVISVET